MEKDVAVQNNERLFRLRYSTRQKTKAAPTAPSLLGDENRETAVLCQTKGLPSLVSCLQQGQPYAGA